MHSRLVCYGETTVDEGETVPPSSCVIEASMRMEEREEERQGSNGRLTVADRVARAAVYGYAVDVISAALYAYAVLPRRWRKLVELVREQQARERDAWVKIEATRKRLARIRVASALQRLYRRKKNEKMICRDVVRRFIVHCVYAHRRRRRHAAWLWWRHAVMPVCASHRSCVLVLQRRWRSCVARRRFLGRVLAAKVVQAAWRSHHHSRKRAKQLMMATDLITKWMTVRMRILKLKSAIKKRRVQEELEVRRRYAVVEQGLSRLWAIWRRHRAMMALVIYEEGQKEVDMSVFEEENKGNQTFEQEHDADDQDELCKRQNEIAEASSRRIARFCRHYLIAKAKKTAQRPEIDDNQDLVIPSDTVVRFGRVPIRAPRRIGSSNGVSQFPPKRQPMRRRLSERRIAEDTKMVTCPTTKPSVRPHLPPLSRSLESSSTPCAEVGRRDEMQHAAWRPRLIADCSVRPSESLSRMTSAARASDTTRTPLRPVITSDDSNSACLPSLTTKSARSAHRKHVQNPSGVRLPSLMRHERTSNQDGDRWCIV